MLTLLRHDISLVFRLLNRSLIEGSSYVWQFKKNRKGELTPAVLRRSRKFYPSYEVDIASHNGRSKFGYCYLMYNKKGELRT